MLPVVDKNLPWGVNSFRNYAKAYLGPYLE